MCTVHLNLLFLQEADKLNRRTEIINDYEKRQAEKAALKKEKDEEDAEDEGLFCLSPFLYEHIV